MDISDDLFRLAKKRAADDGVPLRQVVETALRNYLASRPRRTGYRLRWSTEGGGLMPGVIIDDRDALFDLMNGKK